MCLRFVGGVIGLAFVAIPIFILLSGKEVPGSLWSAPLIGIPFLVYAIGGARLLARIAPGMVSGVKGARTAPRSKSNGEKQGGVRESDMATETARLISQLGDLGSPELKARMREEGTTVGEPLCDLYLEGDEAARAAIRQFMAERPSQRSALLRLVRSFASRIPKGRISDSVVYTRRALAAASMENLGHEWRSTHSALRKIYKAAVKAGVDAQQYFREAADYSSNESPYPHIEDHPSMRVFLEDLAEQFGREIGGR